MTWRSRQLLLWGHLKISFSHAQDTECYLKELYMACCAMMKGQQKRTLYKMWRLDPNVCWQGRDVHSPDYVTADNRWYPVCDYKFLQCCAVYDLRFRQDLAPASSQWCYSMRIYFSMMRGADRFMSLMSNRQGLFQCSQCCYIYYVNVNVIVALCQIFSMLMAEVSRFLYYNHCYSA